MELDDLSRDELLEEAKRLGLRGLTQKDKKTIRLAVAEKRREMEDAGEDPDARPEAPVQGDPLTHEQIQKLRQSPDEVIQAALKKDPNMNPLWRKSFEDELAARAKKRQAEEELKARQTPMEGYLVTKGGPFVVNGRITQIRTGGVVYETTHSLDDLDAQGIEYEPLGDRKVVVERGRLGVPTSKIVG